MIYSVIYNINLHTNEKVHVKGAYQLKINMCTPKTKVKCEDQIKYKNVHVEEKKNMNKTYVGQRKVKLFLPEEVKTGVN